MPCGCGSHALTATMSQLVLRACTGCGHVSVDGGSAAAEIYSDPSYAGFVDDVLFARNAASILGSVRPDRVNSPTLLDIGCGNGAVLEVAAGLGYQAFGIDVSAPAVAAARARGCEAAVLDVTAAVARGPWDVVTMFDVLEHVSDPGPFLDGAARCVRHGGVLVVKTPTVDGRRAWILARGSPRLARMVLQAPAHQNAFSETALRRLLRDAGLEVEHLRRLRQMRSAPSAGRVRKRMGRRIVRTCARLVRTDNFVVHARRPS